MQVDTSHSTSAVQPATHREESSIAEQLNNRIVEVMKEIVADSDRRLKSYQSDLTVLSSGCWYGNEYYKILKEKNQSKRLKFFLEDGAFYHGWASKKHFVRQSNPSKPAGYVVNFLKLKDGVTPSEGLKAFRSELTLTACGEICQIAQYEGIKAVWGEKKFNAIFSAQSKTPFSILFDNPNNPLAKLFVVKKDVQVFKKGDLFHFQNTLYYPGKHVNGEAAGYNVICCDDTPGQERFTALGLDPNGSTIPEIKQKMKYEYNLEPIGCEIVTKEVGERILGTYTAREIAYIETLKDHQIDDLTFASTGGGVMIQKISLDVEKISLIAKLPLEEAVRTFNSW